MGKLAGIVGICLIGAAAGGLYYIHSPKTMMQTVVNGMNSGQIEDYFIGEAKSALDTAQKGGDWLSSFSAAAETKIVEIVMQKMSETEWTLDSVSCKGDSGKAYVDFKYVDKYLDIDGTIEFNLEKIQPESSLFDNLLNNQWRISSIENIDF